MKKFLMIALALLTNGLLAQTPCYNTRADCYNFTLCDADFTLSLDWLYWKARRCDLDIVGVNGTQTLSFLSPTVQNSGKVLNLGHDYQSGVRFAAGMQWCSGWGFGFEYLYFSPKDETSLKDLEEEVTLTRIPTVAQELLLFAYNIDAVFDLELNQLDVLFSYQYATNPCREVQSYFGARFAWLDDHLTTSYQEGEIIGDPVNLSLHEKNDLNAYGLIVGGQIYQNVWCSLGLYMRAAFSVLYGSYDQTSNVTLNTQDSAINIEGYDYHTSPNCLLSILDLVVGIGFEGCQFCCAKWGLILGYEFHNWFAYRDYLRPLVNSDEVLIRNKADLGFDGLFLRLGVQF